MTTETHQITDEAAWHALRAQDVTSTESAALYPGLQYPYGTELELFHRKASGDAAIIEDNPRMKAGRYLEPSIAELAGSELGCEVRPLKVYMRDPDVRMGSSFDFEIISGELDGWLLEIKNVDYLVYRDKWEDDEAPDWIECQVQHEIEVADRPGCVIACLVGGNDLRLILRERNRKMGAAIRARIEKFWQDVAAGNAPEPDYLRDADYLIALHQSAGDEVFDAREQPELVDKLREYKRIRGEAGDLDKLSRALKAQILETIGDDVNKVIADGVTLSCGMTKDSFVEAHTRKGYRQFRVTVKA